MRYIVSRNPWRAEDLGQTKLVPVSIGSALLNGPGARVDIKQYRRMICVRALTPSPKNARERLDATWPRSLSMSFLQPPPATVYEVD